jgi:uncharacterized protein with beta-barrel porin domain
VDKQGNADADRVNAANHRRAERSPTTFFRIFYQESSVSDRLPQHSFPAPHPLTDSSQANSSGAARARAALLGGASILAVLLLCSPAPALAACSNTAPVSGETVECTGASTTPITANGAQNGITVNLRDGAQLNSGVSDAINLGGSAHINLFGNSQIVGDSNTAIFVVGPNSGLTMSGNSTITGSGISANGIRFDGDNSVLTFNDNAAIITTGPNGDAIHAFGDNMVITFNDQSSINVQEGAGLRVGGTGTHITLNGRSSIQSGGFGVGINFYNGNHRVLTINDQASVRGRTNSSAVLLGHDDTLINRGTLSSETVTTLVGDTSSAHSDTVQNFGTISSGSGTAIDLGAGNDSLTLGTGSKITGLALIGTGSDGNVFLHFETLTMNGQDWSLSGTSSFATRIDVTQGRLAINGAIDAPATNVANAGILGGSGTLTSNVTSDGTIAPGNSPGTLNIVGNLTQNGGAFDIESGKAGTDRLNVTGAVTLNGGPTVNVIPVGGASGTNAVFLHSDTSITGGIGAVNYQGNGAAIVSQTATDLSLISVDGTPLVASDFAAAQTGLDFLDDVAAEQVAGLGGCDDNRCGNTSNHLWARGFGRFATEAARDGNQAFDYRIAGTAVGGDMEVAKGLRIGASLGYSNTETDLSQQAANADIDSGLAALYANYRQGSFFVTGAVSGGWQSFDLSRRVKSTQIDEADATTHGWLFGSSLQAGARFSFPHGWLLTPSAGIAYQHQWINGYGEHGAGAGDVSIADHQADALRLRAQLVLSQAYQLTGYSITPHLKLGVQQQYNFGGNAGGSFSDGSDFSLALADNSRTIGLVGLGAEVAFDNGLATYVDYDGALASGRTVHAVTGGLRYSW